MQESEHQNDSTEEFQVSPNLESIYFNHRITLLLTHNHAIPSESELNTHQFYPKTSLNDRNKATSIKLLIYEGGPQKMEFIYKKLCIHSYVFKLQSPSKYSPFDAIYPPRCFFPLLRIVFEFDDFDAF